MSTGRVNTLDLCVLQLAEQWTQVHFDFVTRRHRTWNQQREDEVGWLHGNPWGRLYTINVKLRIYCDSSHSKEFASL